MIGPIKMLRLIRAVNAGQPLLPWQNPPDFTGRERTRLFASELDILRENQLDLDARLQGLFPAGVMLAWAGNEGTPPAGWLICQGQALSTGVYPTLHAAIGYSYGGSGTLFNLPDLRGRVFMGAGTGPGLTARTRGQLVGTETVAITLAQMAAHSHTINEHTHYTSGQTGGHNVTHWHGGGGHTHTFDHWHIANIANVKYLAGAIGHGHGGGAGVAAEAPSPNDGFGAPVAVNVEGRGGVGNQGPTAGPSGGTDAADRDHSHGWSGTSGGASNRGTDSQGSGQGHANMQPGVVIGGAIIKT